MTFDELAIGCTLFLFTFLAIIWVIGEVTGRGGKK